MTLRTFCRRLCIPTGAKGRNGKTGKSQGGIVCSRLAFLARSVSTAGRMSDGINENSLSRAFIVSSALFLTVATTVSGTIGTVLDASH
jgi:hypothetical protein